ncbi:MAG: alpha/beta fold hydrolase, partial [Actinomycetota bacterium]
MANTRAVRLALTVGLVTVAACASDATPSDDGAVPSTAPEPAPPQPAPSTENSTAVATSTTTTTSTTTAPTSSTTTLPGPEITAEFTEVACWAELEVPADAPARCGTVEVAPGVDMAVAIAEVGSPDGPDDPILELVGGPGFSGTIELGDWIADPSDAGGRDVVLVDYRGIGRSTPLLDCPERDEALRATYADTIGFAAELDLIIDTTIECRDRLIAAGAEPTSIDSDVIAADLELVRQALGIESWNVVATSYGTNLALAMIRAQQPGLRSVVLDSVYPPDRNSFVDYGVNAEAAIRERLALCAADAACGERFPDLENRFFASLDELQSDPYRSDIADPLTGDVVPIAFDGADAFATVYFALWDNGLTTLIPTLADAVITRNAGLLDTF